MLCCGCDTTSMTTFNPCRACFGFWVWLELTQHMVCTVGGLEIDLCLVQTLVSILVASTVPGWYDLGQYQPDTDLRSYQPCTSCNTRLSMKAF